MTYKAGPLPEDLPSSLAIYLDQEMRKIELAINNPVNTSEMLTLQQALPNKPQDGQLGNFAATVATASRGLHFNNNGTWVFIA